MLRLFIIAFFTLSASLAVPQEALELIGRHGSLESVMSYLSELPLSEAQRVADGVAEREAAFVSSVAYRLVEMKSGDGSRQEAILAGLLSKRLSRSDSEVIDLGLVSALAPRLNTFADSYLRRLIMNGMVAYPSKAFSGTLSEYGTDLVLTLEQSRKPEPPAVVKDTEAFLAAIRAHRDPALGYFAARVAESSRVESIVRMANQVARALIR